MTTVLINTTLGNIIVETDAVHSVATVENFLAYVNKHHYDGTIFHRVIPNFMIQGGHFDAEMKERPANAPILNESQNGLKNEKYTLAMARTQDPHSATDQFFINAQDNAFLNAPGQDGTGYGYTVFAKVTEGQDVVDKICQVKTTRKGQHSDVPAEPVVILSMTVIDPVTKAPVEDHLPITQ